MSANLTPVVTDPLLHNRTVTVQVPSDGDSLNAASVIAGFQALTNLVASLLGGTTAKGAALLKDTNVFAGTNTFNGTTALVGLITAALQSSTNAATPALSTTVAPAAGHRKLVASFAVGGVGASSVNVYSVGNWFLDFVVNATWDDGGLQWNRIVNGFQAQKVTVYANGLRMSSQTAGGPDTWADNAWSNLDSWFYDSIAGTFSVVGAGAKSLTTSAGALTLSAAGGNAVVETTDANSAYLYAAGTGNAVVQASHAAAGDTQVVAGNDGTIALAAQVGCIKMSTAAVNGGNVSFSNYGGGTSFDTTVAVSGDNSHGTVTVKKAGGGDAVNPIVIVSWAGAPLTTAPKVTIGQCVSWTGGTFGGGSPNSVSIAGLYEPPTTSGFKVAIYNQSDGHGTVGSAYTFSWHAFQ